MNQLQVNNHSMNEIDFIAKKVASSSMFPTWKGKEADAALAIMFGKSIGLSWGYSLMNIMVVNGRPTVWGDAMLALCKNSSAFEYCHETFDAETMTAICEAKRKNEQPETRTFSKEDAMTAKLWSKSVWQSYPQRMLQMRARTFALRDVFPDVLQGLGSVEEVMDYPESETTQPQIVASKSKAEKIFARFEELGIQAQTILAHYEKESIYDFTEEELQLLIVTGKAVGSGEINPEDAFPLVHESKTEEIVAQIEEAL